jgi:hypothetical protein
MDRYYKTEDNISQRTQKNKSLYNEIHNTITYDDYKQIPRINEKSEEKLKELIEEEKKPKRQYKEISRPSVFEEIDKEQKNYDINEALEKAKSNNQRQNYNYHKLAKEQLELIDKIKNYKASKKEDDENLNELLNTLASTSLLKDLNDKDLSLNLLSDLKSDDENTQVAGIETVNEILEAKEKYEKENKDDNFVEENTEKIDNSFYTSSMKFDREDFDDIEEIKTNLNKNNKLMKIITIILIISLILVVILILK